MVRTVTDPVAAGAPEAWVRLRAIRTLVDHGWVGYGGVWRWHRQVIVLPDHAGLRVLDRDEVVWWALGFADGRRRGGEVLVLRDELVPDIIPLQTLTDEYGENRHTAYAMWRQGKLYRLWLKTRAMHVFRAQYVAQLATWALAQGDLPPANEANVPGLLTEWRAIQDLIPRLPPDAGEQATLDASTQRPPAINAVSGYERRGQALTMGGATAAGEGWFAYEGVGQGGVCVLAVPTGRGNVVTRRIPEPAILPYVLGMGDSHGHGYLVTYQAPPGL